MGWGAYYGLATRQSGLTRWQRGELKALVEIPALIADIDEPPEVALPRIRAFPILPTCIISSGHGVHAYWLLNEPTTNMQMVNAIHRGLAQALKGDYLTAVTALRLPGSLNTKPGRGGAFCRIVEYHPESHYALSDFVPFSQPTHGALRSHNHISSSYHSFDDRPNKALVHEVIQRLMAEYGGYMKSNGWLAALCPCGHMQDRPGQHFGFNPQRGVGVCFGRHGGLPLNVLSSIIR